MDVLKSLLPPAKGFLPYYMFTVRAPPYRLHCYYYYYTPILVPTYLHTITIS